MTVKQCDTPLGHFRTLSVMFVDLAGFKPTSPALPALLLYCAFLFPVIAGWEFTLASIVLRTMFHYSIHQFSYKSILMSGVLDGIGHPHSQFAIGGCFRGNFSFPVTSTPGAMDTFYCQSNSFDRMG